jgi:hypothetical protein
LSPSEVAPADEVRATSNPTAAALALALASSVPAGLPALVRILPATPNALGAVALLGSVSLLVVPTALWLRRAVAAGLPASDRALLAGTALSALPLALFGGVLKSTTHHRPLGGATFAVAALCLLALCIGLAFRVFRGAGHGTVKPAWRNLFTLGCGLSLAGALLLGTARAALPSLVDFLALAAGVAGGGLVRPPAPLTRVMARVKLPVVLTGWAVLLTCAVVLLRQAGGEVTRSLSTQAPVSFAALSWLGVGF